MRRYLLLIICLFQFFLLSSQPLEVTNGTPYTPESLITSIFLGDGVEVLNVQFEGDPIAVGYFKNGDDEVGINRGIIMTSGSTVSSGLDVGVAEPGFNFASSPTSNLVTDLDMEAIANDDHEVNDVTKYTITFIPISDTLRFRYVFASEEYPEYTCSDFNDIFGFFISGPGISGTYENNADNIALIPGTNLPVTINNVNSGVVGDAGTIINCTPPLGTLGYSQYYNDNNETQLMPVYDGLTDVFTAEAIVMPCDTYTIKLVICDVGDTAYDSGVFLEAKSFGTGALNIEVATASLDGSIAEGCQNGSLTFSLPNAAETDFPLDYQILGTAENGLDYELIQADLFIPQGRRSISVPIIAIEDGIIEDTETLILDIQRDQCNRDTFYILIKDNPLVDPHLGPDLSICSGDSIALEGTLMVDLPAPPSFTNSDSVFIDPPNQPFYSDIQVNGVIPDYLAPGVIQSVCIDSLYHPWIDDLDIYLISPDGQILELTTDNGGNGGNSLGPDYYLHTCFTPEATNPINFPGPFAPPDAVPFTGEFAPEGVWGDLWDGIHKTNGEWRLFLLDDTGGAEGILYNWTITFNPIYKIEYSWYPTTGLSCSDCPNPMASPEETTTYYLTAFDSYGCEVRDSITIEVDAIVEAPELFCGTITDNSITINWQEVQNANEYVVSIDGGAWTSPTGVFSHTASGLSLSQEVSFEVMAVGDCNGPVSTISCSTPDCTPPEATAIPEAVSCFGGDDGTVQVMTTGGVAPYHYSIGSLSNDSGVFSDLQMGSYVVTIVDAVDCPLNLQFDISGPEEMDAQAVLIEGVRCKDHVDGSATFVLSGGMGPYSFQWSNNEMDSIAIVLPAGANFVTITDGNGCTTEAMIEVPEPEALSVSLSSQQVSCADSGDGMATATPSGGTGSYEYLWDISTGSQLTQTATGLSGGTYSVTITDANACTTSESIEILEMPPLTLEISTADALCFEGNDGAALSTAGGGSGDFSFTWANALTGETIGADEPSIDQLSAGDYYLVLSDSDLCRDTAFFSIGQPEALFVSIITDSVTCQGVPDGTAALNIEGGTSPFEYNWEDIGIGPDQRHDLAAGGHAVTVSDANDCFTMIEFNIEAPETILLSVESTMVNCFGGNNGTATVTPSGGTGPYHFNWADGQQLQTATDLSAGEISVEVVDEKGCVEIAIILIDQFPELTLSIEGTDPACFGDTNGSATVIAEGGAGGYAYLWSDNQQEATAIGLAVGNYELTMTDANNCSEQIDITLSQPDALSAVLNSVEAGCSAASQGVASLIAAGGTLPYSYLWSDANGQEMSDATGLEAGIYTVTLTDSHDCTLIESIEVASTPGVALTLSGTDVSCFGDNDGSILLEAQGGAGTYTYSWDVAGTPAVSNPQGLSAGNYTVTVTDPDNCIAIESYTIEQPVALELSAEVHSVACSGNDDGAIDLSVSGGVAPYEVLWSNDAQEQNISNLIKGFYSVSVTDANGCMETMQVEVVESAPLYIEFEVDDVNCFGEATGAIQAQISGGAAPYNYLWSNGATGEQIENLPGGVHVLELTDGAGCVVLDSVEVNQPANPLLADISVVDVSCYEGRDGYLYINPSGGTAPYLFSRDGFNFSGNSPLIGLKAGLYTVLLKDARGCLVVYDDINIGQPDALLVDLGPDTTIVYGQVLSLIPEISNAFEPITYEWWPADSTLLSCWSCPSPDVFVLYQTSFELSVTDNNGCRGEDIITVFVVKENFINVPTGFSPNGDGVNDILRVHGKEGINIRLFRVYDRWGELLFEKGGFQTNDEIGWDGSFRGKNMNPGEFLWTLEVEYEDGTLGSFKGSSTLLR